MYSVNSDERYKRAVSRAFSNWAQQAYPSHGFSTPEIYRRAPRFELENLEEMED